LTDFTDIHFACNSARETAGTFVVLTNDGTQDDICHITLQLFPRGLTKTNLALKFRERADYTAGHIYRNNQLPHCYDTACLCALTVEHFKVIWVKCCLNIGEKCTYLNTGAKYTAHNTSSSVHKQLYLFTSELSTVLIFLCPNVAITVIKNFVARKHAVFVHSNIDGKCGRSV
jgi:hypothetical protein